MHEGGDGVEFSYVFSVRGEERVVVRGSLTFIFGRYIGFFGTVFSFIFALGIYLEMDLCFE